VVISTPQPIRRPFDLNQLGRAIGNGPFHLCTSKGDGKIALYRAAMQEGQTAMLPLDSAKLGEPMTLPGGTRITDTGLLHLKRLTSLRYLSLHGTGISDAGLVHLGSLRKLEDLDLSQTHVTRQAVQSLQAALPKATIRVGQADLGNGRSRPRESSRERASRRKQGDS